MRTQITRLASGILATVALATFTFADSEGVVRLGGSSVQQTSACTTCTSGCTPDCAAPAACTQQSSGGGCLAGLFGCCKGQSNGCTDGCTDSGSCCSSKKSGMFGGLFSCCQGKSDTCGDGCGDSGSCCCSSGKSGLFGGLFSCCQGGDSGCGSASSGAGCCLTNCFSSKGNRGEGCATTRNDCCLRSGEGCVSQGCNNGSGCCMGGNGGNGCCLFGCCRGGGGNGVGYYSPYGQPGGGVFGSPFASNSTGPSNGWSNAANACNCEDCRRKRAQRGAGGTLSQSILAQHRARNAHAAALLTGQYKAGGNTPWFGTYSRVYAQNPHHFDQRDGQIYGVQGYGTPLSVPLAPNVRQAYNYGWGIPSSRLTKISQTR